MVEKKDEKNSMFKDKIETKVVKIKEVIETKLMQLKDLATIEVLMPVAARMKERLKSIQSLGAARSIKINGVWKTNPPKMHISALKGEKVSNDEAIITFNAYETDDKGNKKLHENVVEVVKENGDKVNRVLSAQYDIAFQIKETIRKNEPIKREVIDMRQNK